jgi:hypothetical protein
MKTKGYVREGYTQTIGDRISFADAIVDGKKTIYFEILVEDKKESVIYVLDSDMEAMRLAMSLLLKTQEEIMAKLNETTNPQ